MRTRPVFSTTKRRPVASPGANVRNTGFDRPVAMRVSATPAAMRDGTGTALGPDATARQDAIAAIASTDPAARIPSRVPRGAAAGKSLPASARAGAREDEHVLVGEDRGLGREDVA